MEFIEITFLFIALFMGFLSVVCGLAVYRSPPGSINRHFGYRTPRSMRDQESWNFSQKYSGRLMALLGLMSTTIALAVWYVCEITLFVFFSVFFIQTALIMSVIPLTEAKLKKMR